MPTSLVASPSKSRAPARRGERRRRRVVAALGAAAPRPCGRPCAASSSRAERDPLDRAVAARPARASGLHVGDVVAADRGRSGPAPGARRARAGRPTRRRRRRTARPCRGGRCSRRSAGGCGARARRARSGGASPGHRAARARRRATSSWPTTADHEGGEHEHDQRARAAGRRRRPRARRASPARPPSATGSCAARWPASPGARRSPARSPTAGRAPAPAAPCSGRTRAARRPPSSPVTASEMSGKNVPQNTTKARPTSTRLLPRKTASRESSESSRCSERSVGAARDDQVDRRRRSSAAMSDTNGTPSVEAPKAWIESRIPERTRNVPSTASVPVARISDDVPHLQHPALLLHHDRVQERGAGQPRQQRRVLDRVPGPVAAPAQLGVGPARAEQDADAEEEPRRRARSAAWRGSSRRRRAARRARRPRRRTGTAHSVYPEYSIGGWIIMLGWRSSGLRPLPSGGATASVSERRDGEDEQRGEERRRSPAAPRRVGRHVAQAPARRKQHEARPQRQQPQPQQQRALLRGPRRRGP